MSDTKAAETEAPSAPGPSKAPLLLALVNTLAVLGAVGMFYYTKVMYKRPAITEESERKRLEEAKAAKTVVEATAAGTVAFDPVTVNIESYPAPPPVKPGSEEHPGQDGSNTQKGKLHYVTLAFSLELVDIGQKAAVDEVKAVIMDQVLSLLSHKPFHDLTTVQGRYVLRTQIMEMVNRLTRETASHPPVLASSLVKPKAKEGGHGDGGHGGGGEHGAPPADAHGGGGEHGAPPADAHGGGGEHGGGGHGDGGGHGGGEAKKETAPPGPPLKELYRDGIVSNVFFTQFIVQ